MPQYRWRAIDINGVEHEGILWASSPDQLAYELAGRELGLMQATAVRLGRFFDRLALSDKLAFFQHLDRLISAGLLVPASLELMARQGRPLVRNLTHDIARCVASGLTLADALALWPRYFDSHLVAIMRVGQESGGLDQALKHACSLLTARQSLREQVFTAIRVPIITTVFFVASVTVILLVVVPQFEQILSLTLVKIDATHSFLFGVSRALRSLKLIEVIGWVAVSMLATLLILRAGLWRRLIAFVFESVPVVNTISWSLCLSLFFQSMALLVAGGASLARAAQLASAQAHVGPMRDRLQCFAYGLTVGQPIGLAYKQALGTWADTETEALLTTAHVAGVLETALAQIALTYNQRCQKIIARSVACIQPGLMLALGLLVAILVYGVYVPLAQLPASFEQLY